MRIVRIKLAPEVSEYLRTLCAQYSFNDLSFFEDIYSLALTKGGGLPDDARLDKLTEAYAKINEMNKMMVRVLLRKRRVVLKTMIANPLFLHFTRTKKAHPRVTTEALISFYFDTYRRVRQSQCMTCNLVSACAFGQTYGKLVTAVQAVVDPDYKQKVNPACPEMPTLDFVAQMAASQAAIAAMAKNPAQLAAMSGDPAASQMAQNLPSALEEAERLQAEAPQDEELDDDTLPKSIEDEWEQEEEMTGLQNNNAVPPGDDHSYTTSFKSPSVIIDMTVVNQIKMHNFLLFELARKLSSKLVKAHAGKLRPSTAPSKSQKTTQITSVSDVTKVLPREHAKDDDVFERGLLQQNLTKRQFQKADKKRHLLYILLDTSGSMTSCVAVAQTFWSVVTRGLLASSFMLALVNLMEAEDGILFTRGFDGGTSPLKSGRVKAEYDDVRNWIAHCGFNGCTTNIPGALSQAYEDINAASDELRDAEILLITDCGCRISVKDVAKMKADAGKIVLNVMDVASNSDHVELAAGAMLRSMADHYFKVDGSATTLDKLVSLVGGSKAPSRKIV